MTPGSLARWTVAQLTVPFAVWKDGAVRWQLAGGVASGCDTVAAMDRPALSTRVTVLAGGGGGARLADGVAAASDNATVIVNTGDDAQIYGLWVSPDIDTVMYTLADVIDPEAGWGRRDETYVTQGGLAELGEDTWFTLGDRDLATHISRTRRLRCGQSLTQVTADLCAAMGVGARVVPMSDEPVSTWLDTDHKTMAFQEYFVRRKHQDRVHAITFDGIESARPAPGVVDAITSDQVVIFGPSNPFVSIGPILAVPGVRDALQQSRARRIAVSPIIGGAALKGPAADMLDSLGHEVSSLGVARLYRGLIDVFVIDSRDAAIAAEIEALGIEVQVTDTMIAQKSDRLRLAGELLAV